MCALGQPAHMPVSFDVGRIAVDIDQLDVAAVSLQERPDPLEHRFDPFSGDHVSRKGNAYARKTAPKTRRIFAIPSDRRQRGANFSALVEVFRAGADQPPHDVDQIVLP